MLVLMAVLVLGGCASDRSMRGTAPVDHSPTNWRVANNLKFELTSIDKMKSNGNMTEPEYMNARNRIISHVIADTYITDGDYLNSQLSQLSAMRQAGQLSEEEFSKMRETLVKRYVDRLGQ